jgi:hypothetical protein
MSIADWYYDDEDKDDDSYHGPVALDRLVALLRSGEISLEVLVSTDTVKWDPADKVEVILRKIPIDRERIIREYIEYGEADNPEWGWASDRLFSMLDGAPELAWELIVELIERAPSDKSLGFFAAGPLEQLLSDHGPTFIERVEERAASSAKFQRAAQSCGGYS